MQTNIEECVQSQRPAQRQRLLDAQHDIGRRTQERQHQQDQRGFAGAVGDLLNRVGGQMIVQAIPDQQRQWDQAGDMDKYSQPVLFNIAHKFLLPLTF